MDIVKLGKQIALKKLNKLQNPKKNTIVVLNDYNDGYSYNYYSANLENKFFYFSCNLEDGLKKFKTFNGLKKDALKYISYDHAYADTIVSLTDDQSEKNAVINYFKGWTIKIEELTENKLKDFVTV